MARIALRSIENILNNKIVDDRYLMKINEIGCDPYKLGKQDFDDEEMPPLSYPDIVNYFLYKKSFYTEDQMRAYKSLEAYDFFCSGWVKEIKTKKLNDYILVMGKVSHSQRLNEPPLQPWALVYYSGKIDMVYCTCMAGKGEACSHAAAILFYVEHYNRRKIEPACTDVKSKWIIPTQKNAECKKIKDIDFRKASLRLRSQKPSCKENENSVDNLADGCKKFKQGKEVVLLKAVIG